MTLVAASFVFFLLIFLGIGVYSATRKQDTTADYLIAGRSVGPWAMALSAAASNNSGFMFVGLIGATFTDGISALIMMLGWTLGDYLAWILRIPDAVRERSERAGSLTVPSFLGHGIPGGRAVVVIAGVVVLLFLGTYAAAQLTAGSKALHALFGWDVQVGAILGALIVVIYCFSGGIRASIWTDVAQSCVMVVAMNMVLLLGVVEAGGPAELWRQLGAIDPQLIDLRPASLPFGFALFALGWFVTGFGVVGQPHIMVRMMTLDSETHMARARKVYVVWNVGFSLSAVGVGLTARLLLDSPAGFDPELALPMLSTQLLPPVLVGLVLAGLFAATMSTADSQVLSCSAALTQDIAPRRGDNPMYAKLGTLVVTAVVLAIALQGTSVFGLVVLAWSGLAASLGPLLVVRALGRRPHAATAIAMMLSGVGAALVWKYGLQFSGGIYEAMPGMLTGGLVYFAFNAWLGEAEPEAPATPASD